MRIQTPGIPGNSHVFLLSALCRGYGLKHVVISPGSRNAPLIKAFHEEEGIACYIVPDERSAGYFALGIALTCREAVGILCTSGTAALNLVPAIAEAFYQGIPLLVLTADRPPEWTGQKDGQTISQLGIYSNFTVFEAVLPARIQSADELWHTERILRDAFLALREESKPVHLNIPLREPLYHLSREGLQYLKPARFSLPDIDSRPLPKEIWDELLSCRRVLLVIGNHAPDPGFSGKARRIQELLPIPVLAENLSNLAGCNALLTSDALFHALNSGSESQLEPELLISFGDALLSKSQKQWLRSLKNTKRWVVSRDKTVADSLQGTDRLIRMDAGSFLEQLTANVHSFPAEYRLALLAVWGNCQRLTEELHRGLPWCDMQVFSILSRNIPKGTRLHLSNSSPVRYAQLFRWTEGIEFYSNRGTAGIDGCSSTAMGVASVSDTPLCLITGDVAFLYDTNAFWNGHRPRNFRVIVINNLGGNIFDLIRGPSELDIPVEYFRTHYPVSIAGLCQAYGIRHSSVSGAMELESALPDFFADPGPSVLEIQTDPDINASVWKNFFTSLKKSLQNES